MVVYKTGSFSCGIRGLYVKLLIQLWDKGVVCKTCSFRCGIVVVYKTGSFSCWIRGLYVKLAYSVVG